MMLPMMPMMPMMKILLSTMSADDADDSGGGDGTVDGDTMAVVMAVMVAAHSCGPLRSRAGA